MTRWLALVAFAACSETHGGGQADLASTDCMTCHTPADLPHDEASFPLQHTKHTAIACADCHHFDRGPGERGVHADCTELCHLQSTTSSCCEAIEPMHLGRAGYAWDSTNHDFCLTCHPAGMR